MDGGGGNGDDAGQIVWCYSGAPDCCVYKGHSDSVICLQSSEGKLISGSVDNTIRVWSVQQPTCENVLQGHTDWVRCMHVSGSTLASGSDDLTIRLWDLQTCECTHVLSAQSVNCVQLRGDVAFYGTEEGGVFGIDVRSGQQVVALEGHTQSVNCMLILPNSSTMLTGSGDCTVRVWDLGSESCVDVVRTHSFSVNCVSVQDGIMYTGSGDCSLHAVDMQSLEQVLAFKGHTSPVFCLDLIGELLVSGSGDCSLRIWNAKTAQCLKVLPGSPGQTDVMFATGHMDWVNAIASADGYIFSGSVDRTIRRWHAASLLSNASAPGSQAEDTAFTDASFTDTMASLGEAGMVPEHVRKNLPNVEGFAWGHNRDGALGLGHQESMTMPVSVEALQGCGAVQVACGGGAEEHHTAIVTQEGGLLTFGSGASGQLGQDNNQNLPLPVPVFGLDHVKVASVACGSAHTLANTRDGALFAFGWGHFGQLGIGSTTNTCSPVHVAALEKMRVTRMACGSAHSVVTTDTGKVFAWGWGVNGQLGHGDDSTLLLPTQVKRLDNVYVSSISCGLAHTVAISEVDKQVYTWGWDEYGQLGHGGWDLFGRGMNRVPRAVKDLQGKFAKQAACGSSHTIILTAKGDLYTFGWGKDGQLGLGPLVKDKKNPTLIKGLGDITMVSACGSHSLALQSDGTLWAWGQNTSGQLGLGHTEPSNVPIKVPSVQGYTIHSLSCAGSVRYGHSIALTGRARNVSSPQLSSIHASPSPAKPAGNVSQSSTPQSQAKAQAQAQPLISFDDAPQPAQTQGSAPHEHGGGGVVIQELTHDVSAEPEQAAITSARERLANMAKRVQSAHGDHTNGLNRLLSEFATACEGLQKRKKEAVQARQALAQEMLKLQQQISLLKQKQAEAAAAEQFEDAEGFSTQIAISEGDLARTREDARCVMLRYEQLEEERAGYLRKEVLARREAFKFLSSVKQDADAKAQQYISDAHAQVENERSASERSLSVCSTRLEELQGTCKELDSRIDSMRDKEEMAKRVAKRDEAKAVLDEAAKERESIEEQIRALERTLAIKKEKERECRDALDAAEGEIRALDNSEAGESTEIRHTRAQHQIELQRVQEEYDQSDASLKQVAVEADLLREAEEESVQTLDALQALIETSTAQLAQVESEQRRRHEFTLRRRKLLSEDAGEGGSVSGKDELATCEAVIEQLSQDALMLQQKASKIKQTVATIDGQLSELEVQKQLAVDRKAFKEAAQVSSQIKALTATRDNESEELVRAEQQLKSNRNQTEEQRKQKAALAKLAESKQANTLGTRVQLLKAQARELQLLMEEEIEHNDFEAAALLQVEVETIQANCRLLEAKFDGQKKRSGKESEGGEDVGGQEAAATESTEPGAGAAEGDAEGDEGGADSDEASALQKRIDLLTEQLEAALRDEDFDLCDNLNAEITSVTEKREALLASSK